MTAREMLPAIGQTVEVRFEELSVLCTVLDVKTAYGRPRLLIKPLTGTGSQWVELSRVKLTYGKSATVPRLECKCEICIGLTGNGSPRE